MITKFVDAGVKSSNTAGKIVIKATDGEVGLLVVSDSKVVSSVWMHKEDWKNMMGKLHSVL